MTLEQYIKGRAEKEYYFIEKDSKNSEGWNMEAELKREGYTKGAQDMAELMEGFHAWAFNDDNPFLYQEKTGRYIQMCGNSTSWSYEQLLTLYIEHLNNK